MGKEAMEKDHLKKGEREATRKTGRGEDCRTASASDRGEDGRKSPDGHGHRKETATPGLSPAIVTE